MKKLFLLFILSLQIVLAQTESVSIHHNDWQTHLHLENQPSFFDPSGANIIPMALSKKADLSHTVFGYLPDWEYSDARHTLRFDLLTHIAAFDFYVSASGNISNPSYWPWTDVINAAHANGVKIILTAVNFNNDDIHTLLTNVTAKNNFFTQARDKIITYKLDGINIDFEGLYTADRGTLLNGFMADLTDYMHQEVPGSEVSFAGPAVNWGGWDLAGLASSCDYIFIMGYAFYGSWSSTSGPCAPLTGGSYNISNTVNTQYEAVTENHPEKLILGVPYYGTRWKTVDQKAYASTVEYLGHPRFSNAQTESYQYGREWDTKSQTPWYNYQIGSDWYQAWYDDAISLGLKYDLAESKNYHGVGMWALGYDRDRDELWEELQSRYYFEPQLLVRPEGLIVLPRTGSSSADISISLPDSVQGFYVFWGMDGTTFPDSQYITGSTGTVSNLQWNQLYFFKARIGNSAFSAIAAATIGDDAQVLIVDGFKQNDDNHNQFNYVVQHAKALERAGFSVSSVQNASIGNDQIDLNSYKMVDWFLGDQRDSTLTSTEQFALQNYLKNGGNLLISGSNIGYDLMENGSINEQMFYRDYLKADYRADTPFNSEHFYFQVNAIDSTHFSGLESFYFDDGNGGTYAVNRPDVIRSIDGSILSLAFNGVSTQYGGCGVSYRGRFGDSMQDGGLIYLSFPFETITDSTARFALMDSVVAYFNLQEEEPLSETLTLFQNYPNPFNPETRIKYQIARQSQIYLTVFNVLGQKVHTLVNERQEAGNYSVVFDASELAAGIYFYQLKADNKTKTKKMIMMH